MALKYETFPNYLFDDGTMGTLHVVHVEDIEGEGCTWLEAAEDLCRGITFFKSAAHAEAARHQFNADGKAGLHA